ncbi:hypothetical protein [Flavobacterium sp. ASW18X]|uniref:hypothetical protein n=1 Tax=Flavobacterium sp. ASW18X TaxID=2572595 RepID=UPI0010ADEA93|nr:hypothetical protein [Flavobacterium sp. ASW18X]TKD62551.1 hypothetical protein FBT53_09965 [Flavobacterium sp. ASW18X]
MIYTLLNFFSGKNITNILLLCFSLSIVSSCSKENEEDTFVRLTVNGEQITTSEANFTVGDRSDFNGDIDASFTGNGGTATRVFSWNNNLSTADYNADITATTDGSFQIIVKDAEGLTVLDKTIIGGAEPDSIDGVTANGAPGIWTVTIVAANFNGDGSFSLSAGD